MAVSLNDIKTKIASTKNTSQITNAMQMVSAAKLGRSEEAARNFQVYAQKVRKLLTDILHGNGGNGAGASTNPMLISRSVKKTGYIVITSDRGLVGGYNSSILKAVMELKEEYHPDGKGFEMICIGGMGADFFKARGIQPLYELRGLADQPSFDQVRKIISKTVEMYQNELFDELYVCYNHHVNTLTSQMRVEQMLPIVDLDPNEADEEYSLTFELETSREEILEQLLPQFAESMIYGAIIDAKTAENAAGMTAMQTATDNAKKVINDLTIQYNRARQAAITQEITEIVAGASALE
ncbi:TPA: F0F1 ATP synthase subunit gamma [Streptococcus pneumoniae]